MPNNKSGAMFDYYECQAITVVGHVVSVQSVQSFQLASACKSFEAGIDGWLSVVSGVRVWSETDHKGGRREGGREDCYTYYNSYVQ